jgi:predicted PurR-regulated permease PerM
MHRFHVRKGPAIALTVVFIAAIYVVLSVMLISAGSRMNEKLPSYTSNFKDLYERTLLFLSAHGIQFANTSLPSSLSGEWLIAITETVAPTVAGVVADRLFIAVLSLVFLIEMAEGAAAGRLAGNLVHYGKAVQRFISLTAQTGAISAGINLALFLVLGIDFPGLWCFMYFVLQFIPSVGFLIAIVPPSLIALLSTGSKRAVLVAAGMIVVQMISDYAIQPRFMKKGLHVSLLQILLSLLIWGFLLGPAGAVLAVPLTMTVRKFVENPFGADGP